MIGRLASCLNDRASKLVEKMLADADLYRIEVHQNPDEACWIDCGIKAPGSLAAGLAMARVCMADLADVRLLPGTIEGLNCPQIQVSTDFPVQACLASQYAGWALSVGRFFAMTSGPIRATLAKEAIFNAIGSIPLPFSHQTIARAASRPATVVGVMETSATIDAEVSARLAQDLKIRPEQITLLAARSASLCGTIQVVARALETALHKIEVLGFDLGQIVSGMGTAPLPPIARKDLPAMGRMNDAILYGGDIVLWVRSEDAILEELGPRIPSSSSPEHGVPFMEIFERAGQDFYKIDKMLFSPARISLQNLNTGRSFTFGRIEPDILRRSFME